MRLHCIQHASFESPGNILPWAAAHCSEVRFTYMFEPQPRLPSADAFDALVLTGGPMSVHDEKEHPWLREEKRLVREAIGGGKHVLGICLGAQLIADALGAKVRRNPEPEAGWFPVGLTPEALAHPLFAGFNETFLALHWHAETFDLPKGAVRLAGSEACENQAFLYAEKVLALQFHLELTRESLVALTLQCGEEMAPGRFVQSTQQVLECEKAIAQSHYYLKRLLDRWMPVKESVEAA